MRALVKICAFAVPALLATGEVRADDLVLASHVDAVTVFPDGAVVTRSAEVAYGAGASVLKFVDLPNDIDATSLRASGSSDSALAIDSVATHLAAAERKPDDGSEARLRELKTQRAQVQVTIDALEAKKAMAQGFARATPKDLGSDTKSLSVAEWSSAFDAVATALLKAGDDLRLEEAKARDLDAQIKTLEQGGTLSPARLELRREVDIAVHAPASGKGRIALTYRVVRAGWRPVYDARLDTGGAGGKPALDLVRRAAVSQRSGEDWTNVALTVSTLRAARRTSAPDIDTQRLVFFEPPPMPMSKAAAPPTLRGLAMAPRVAEQPVAPDAAPLQQAAETQGELETGDFQAAFAVPGKVSLAADGALKTFAIATYHLAPDLLVKTVPAIDAAAYLDSHFANPDQAPLLPGEVALYRDGAYVGGGSIGFVAPGEEIDLGFGTDDRVKVVRVPVKRKENEPNWFGQTKTEAREYKTTVKNLHDFPLKIVVVDQIPISENTAITVEQLPATTAPTEKIVADKRGVMSWTYDYAPGQAREIHLAYRMKWPGDRDVVTQAAPNGAK